MVTHYIILCSAYSIGKRIALDYYDERDLKLDILNEKSDYIIEKCGYDVPISTHFIQTNSKKWDSVVEKDKFFEDVELINSEEEFVRIVLFDKDLSGIDIARYILTKVSCTHLKLQKLLYMCYADYLCSTSEKLFNDNIYAYKYGPIVSNVYKKYNGNGSDIIVEMDDIILYEDKLKKLPIRSRIISSKDGAKKILSIDKTLEKYGNMSSTQLVNLTHSKSSPWMKSGEGKYINKEITDELIIKYHKYETI